MLSSVSLDIDISSCAEYDLTAFPGITVVHDICSTASCCPSKQPRPCQIHCQMFGSNAIHNHIPLLAMTALRPLLYIMAACWHA